MSVWKKIKDPLDKDGSCIYLMFREYEADIYSLHGEKSHTLTLWNDGKQVKEKIYKKLSDAKEDGQFWMAKKAVDEKKSIDKFLKHL